MVTKTLVYRFCADRFGKPLVQLESPLGNGQEIYPDELRRLAELLRQLADDSDKADKIALQQRRMTSADY